MLCLPEDIFWNRLEEEISEIRNHEDFEVEKKKDQEYVITIRAKGYELSSSIRNTPILKNSHKVKVIVPREYPYEPPELHWMTPILHSNICPPHESYKGIKGFVCIEGLNYYKPFSFNLVSLCESIRNIIENPNPASTIPTKTPKKASDLIRKNILPSKDEPTIIYYGTNESDSADLPTLIRG